MIIFCSTGDKVRQLELEGIVSSPVQGNIFSVEDFDSFDDVREKVTDSICNSKCNQIFVKGIGTKDSQG